MKGPLSGIRVLELARTLAGPFCGMLLGDMGAEVIKVEQPGVGDETRGFSPPEQKGEACYFLSLNRNKKGITVNLKTEEGRNIVKQLASQSDVLIENFRTGAMAKFGLGYDVLRALNPRLIYCTISGFGRTGPMKDEPGYDLLLQGFGGLMSVTGEPERSPMRVGFSVVDLATGIYAANGIALALLVRGQTGRGQIVETSLMESIMSLQTYHGQSTLATGKAPGRYGTGHPNIVPYQVFETKDGHIILPIPNDWLWQKMCGTLGLDRLKNDERFTTNAGRVSHRDMLVQMITEFTRTRTSSEILTPLKAAGVPCGPVNNIAQALDNPQVSYRDMLAEVDHPSIGTLKMLGIPIKLSETPGSIRIPPPLLGQHTTEVMMELGYSNEDILDFKDRGIV